MMQDLKEFLKIAFIPRGVLCPPSPVVRDIWIKNKMYQNRKKLKASCCLVFRWTAVKIWKKFWKYRTSKYLFIPRRVRIDPPRSAAMCKKQYVQNRKNLKVLLVWALGCLLLNCCYLCGVSCPAHVWTHGTTGGCSVPEGLLRVSAPLCCTASSALL